MNKLVVKEVEFGFNSEEVNKDVACSKKIIHRKTRSL